LGRDQEFKNKKVIGVNLEDEEKKALKDIALRESGGDISPVARKAILEYIEHHKEGNNTFKLDTWNEDPEFKAVPTISSKPETWYKYLNECTDKERLNIQVLSFRINQ